MPRSSALSFAPEPVTSRAPASPTARAQSFRIGHDGVAERETAVAAEVPVALAYNGLPHVVMMATPADLADFALGFGLSEGILAAPAELLDLEVESGEIGIRIEMKVTAAAAARLRHRRRNMAGRTGCGICGVDDLTQVARVLPRVGAGNLLDVAAIRRALEALPGRQPANRETGAIHAAAWAEPSGEIRLAREDVGRHNALDKLIGAMAREGIEPGTGFALITSRCSFEMVQKAASVGIPTLVAISAPTSMALDVAEATSLTLVALARRDSVTVYANPQRIRDLADAAEP